MKDKVDIQCNIRFIITIFLCKKSFFFQFSDLDHVF